LVSGPECGCGAIKVTFERDAFGANAKTSLKIHWGERDRWGPVANCHERLEDRRPVLIAIGVFSAHPANKIAVVEPKPKQGAGIEDGSIHGQLGGLAR
jgi:hypothetical protein